MDRKEVLPPLLTIVLILMYIMATGAVFSTLLLLAPGIEMMTPDGQPLTNKYLYALFTAATAAISVWSVWMIHWRKSLVRFVLPALLILVAVVSEVSMIFTNGYDNATSRSSYIVSVFIIVYLLTSEKARKVLNRQ